MKSLGLGGLVAATLIVTPAAAQEAASAPAAIVLPEPAAPSALLLPRDTPVHLMVLNEVSTKDHDAGHRFRLRVDKPVVVAGRTLVPAGTPAWGELTEAQSSGNAGKSGKLSARLTHIELGGLAIPIEGGTTADGKSGKGETLLGVLAMGPLGLFAKGNNAKIKAGEKMTAFVAEDTELPDAP